MPSISTPYIILFSQDIILNKKASHLKPILKDINIFYLHQSPDISICIPNKKLNYAMIMYFSWEMP